MGRIVKYKNLTFGVLGAASLAGLAAYIGGYSLGAWAGLVAGTLTLTIASLIALFERRISVELLMAIVGIVLLYHNVVFEGLIIYLLYSTAELLEAQVSKLALRRIEKARRLIPRRVAVERDGVTIEVKAEEVKAGDKVLVRKGEVVPVDGVLLDNGIFDTSMVTGEPVPRSLDKGMYVESGYVNIGDPVRIVAVKSPGESTLQAVITRALALLENRGRIQRLIEHLSPYMILSVLAAFALAYVIAEEKAVAVLLAGCPSAFIIDSAASTSYTISLLAGRGILIRGGVALERGSEVGVVVVDKTGTLSMGLPKPARFHPPPGFDVDEARSLIAAAAGASLHPISKAIASTWKTGLITRRAREYSGRGVEAYINGYHVLLGSKDFIEEKIGGIVPWAECRDSSMIVYVAINGGPGYICLDEEVDMEVKGAIDTLKSMGLRLVLASGDKKERVEEVARRVGIEEYHYEMKPNDKAELVEKLRRECRCRVSMIGDGINDIEALATSDFSVAVGNIDAVSSIADAVLLRGFKDSPTLYSKSRSYMKGLIAGFTTAAIIKITTIILGLSGAIPLWLVALIGDDGSTLIATLTSITFINKLKH